MTCYRTNKVAATTCVATYVVTYVVQLLAYVTYVQKSYGRNHNEFVITNRA